MLGGASIVALLLCAGAPALAAGTTVPPNSSFLFSPAHPIDTQAPYSALSGQSGQVTLSATPGITGSKSANAIVEGTGTIAVVIGSPGNTGTVEFQGANSYSLGTTIGNGATLQIDTTTALGSGGVTLSGGGALLGNVTGTLSSPNTITLSPGGTGTIAATSGHVLTIGSAITATSGTLNFGSAAGAGTVLLGTTNTLSVAANVNGGTLDLGGHAQTFDSVVVNNAAIQDGSLTVKNGSPLSMQGGQIGDAAGLTSFTLVKGGLSISGPNETTSIYGTATFDGTVTVASSSTMNVQSGANVSVPNQIIANSGTIINGGTITANVNNDGTALTNNGTWVGGIQNYSTVNNNGAWQGSVENGGVFGPGTFNNNAPNGSVTGGLVNANGTVNNAGTIGNNTTAPNLFANGVGVTNDGGTFENSGTVTQGLLVNGGTAVNATGGTIDTVTVATNGTFDNQSTGTGAGGVTGGLTNSGTSTNEGSIAGGVVNSGGSFTNNLGGSVTGGLSVTGGQAVNATGGTIDTVTVSAGSSSSPGFINQSNANVTAGLNILGGYATNRGSIVGGATNDGGGFLNDVGGTVDTVDNAAGTFDNKGGVTAGLTNTGTATNEGTIANGAGVGVTNNGGTFTNSATVNNGVTVSGGTFVNGSILGTGTVSGGLIVQAGASTVGAATNTFGSTIDTATITAGSLSNAGTITGAVNNQAGTNGAPGFDNASGALVQGGLTNSGVATNEGSITNSTAGGYGVINSGTFTNSGPTVSGGAGGEGLDNTAGTATNQQNGIITGALVSGGSLINQGTVNAASSTTPAVTNSSTGVNTTVGFDNQGTVAGGVLNSGSATNEGSISNTNGVGVTSTAGKFTSSGTIDTVSVTGGAFTNLGSITSSSIVPTVSITGGTFSNSGSITGAVTNSSNGVGLVAGFDNSSLGAVSGLLTNSGFATNEGALNGGVTNNTGGTFTTTGTILHGVINTGTVNASGAISGNIQNNAGGQFNLTGNLTGAGAVPIFNNSGTITTNGNVFQSVTTLNNNAGGLINGPLINVNTFNNFAGATLQNGLTNTGTVNASGGQLNGPIDNRNQFTVTGATTGNGTFFNESAGVFDVNSGSFTLTSSSGLLTNAGSIVVASGATLDASAGGVTNISSGTIVNNGTLNDDLNNYGLVTNNGVYTAVNATNYGGTIVNNATLSWSGAFTNNGGVATSSNATGQANVVDNEGTMNGGVFINNAGTLINNRTLNATLNVAGGVVNSYAPTSVITGNVSVGPGQAVVNALGVINGNVTVNNGAEPKAGQPYPYGGVFNVSDGTLMPAPVGSPQKTLVLNGSLAGPITVPVDLTTGASNFIKVSGSTANASTNITGTLSNPTNLIWTVPNRVLLYSNASIPLAPNATQALAGASATGLYDYVATPNNTGIAQQLKLGAISAPANQISSLITALNTSFFQNAQAFLGAPVNPTANYWYGGVWSRGGAAEMTNETTSTGGGALYPPGVNSRFQSTTGGVQLGLDEGLYNINATGWNAHLGVTGGEAWGYSSLQNSSDPLGGPLDVSGSASMPFYGFYAAVTGNGFAGTVQWRNATYDMNLNNFDLGLNNAQLNAHGDTFSADISQQFPFPPFGEGFIVTPSAAVFVTHTTVNSLNASPLVAPGTYFTFNPLDSTLGRVGLRLSKAYAFNDSLFVVPYGQVNVWREFQGTTTEQFWQVGANGLQTVPAITSSSVGTFGQVALGFAAQAPKAGITSYVQADLRVGSNIQGWGLLAGLRYSY